MITNRQQQTPMTAARITGLVSLGTLLCCLCCCAVPGAIALGVLNYVFEEWPVVEATLIDKTECDSDFDSNSNSNSGSDVPTYYLTYNYVTLDGENITSTTDYCTSLTTASSIRYNPDDPTNILDSMLLNIGLVFSRIVTGIAWTVVIVALGLTIWGFLPNNINNNTNINNNNANANTNTNTNTNNDIEIPSIVSDPNKPIYATAVAVPTGDSYAAGAGIVRYK